MSFIYIYRKLHTHGLAVQTQYGFPMLRLSQSLFRVISS